MNLVEPPDPLLAPPLFFVFAIVASVVGALLAALVEACEK